jgi:hypothetical protein
VARLTTAIKRPASPHIPYRGSGAPYGPPKRYLGEVAERDPERANGEGVGSPQSNGGAGDDLDEWTEDEATFTEDAEFFHYIEDLEDEEEDDEGEGELVEAIDEFGRRHVRRAAPEGTEQILENEAPRRTGLPDSVERWRQRSATGAVLTAFAFGLQSVFEPERKEPAIVMQTSGEPPMDLPVEAQLEQLGPRQSTVTVRPWLLGDGGRADQPQDEAPGDTEADEE